MAAMGERLGASLIDLILPQSCGGCGRPGSAVCEPCLRALADLRFVRDHDAALAIRPEPCPEAWPVCYAWGRYLGVSARVVRAAKDGGRRDLLPILGTLLARSLTGALGRDAPGALVIPAPSAPRTKRARGDHPVRAMGELALRQVPKGPILLDALTSARGVADQAGLGRDARWRNISSAVSVRGRRRPVLAGRLVVLVDDVVTSGATLAACAQACREAGAGEVRAATVLAARRGSGAHRLPKGVAAD